MEFGDSKIEISLCYVTYKVLNEGQARKEKKRHSVWVRK